MRGRMGRGWLRERRGGVKSDGRVIWVMGTG